MTIEDVQDKLRVIQDVAGDNEDAHQAQDALLVEVLRAIVDGCPNSPEMAKEALKVLEIDFDRWYA